MAPESRLQLKVEPDLLELKEKLAVVWFMGFAVEVAIVTAGGVRSMVQVTYAGADTLPVWSVAVTANAWLPAARPE